MTYQVTVTVNVQDVEAESPEEAVLRVRLEIANAFEETVKFSSSSAITYDD